jgi:putative ABC transport system substrate-binding protein
MKCQRIAAFGCPHPRRSLTGEGDLLAAEARLVAHHGARAALALQAVAHGDARWFALNAAGALMSYATTVAETLHQVGIYTGKILKGAKPAELPVVQATTSTPNYLAISRG